MDVARFCACLIKVDQTLQKFTEDEEERLILLKMLVFATMIEAEDDDEIPPVHIRGFNALSHDQHKMIIDLRNSQLLSSLSLLTEKFVYKTLIKVYKQK